METLDIDEYWRFRQPKQKHQIGSIVNFEFYQLSFTTNRNITKQLQNLIKKPLRYCYHKGISKIKNGILKVKVHFSVIIADILYNLSNPFRIVWQLTFLYVITKQIT